MHLCYGWQLCKPDHLTLDQGRGQLDQADVKGKVDLAEEDFKAGRDSTSQVPRFHPSWMISLVDSTSCSPSSTDFLCRNKKKIRHLFSPAEVASSDGELGEPLQGAWSYPRVIWGSYLAAVCCSENPGGGDEAARADKLLKDGESVQGDVGWKLARCSLAASQDPTSGSI